VKNASIVILTIIAGVIAVTIQSGVENNEKIAMGLTEDASSLQDRNNSTVRVMAGGGNDTTQYMAFFPTEVSVNVGQTVTWYNPSSVPEPHTVTFFKDQSQWGNITSSFVIGSDSTNASEIQGQTDGSQKLLQYFSGALEPKVIKADGTIERLAANATYTMNGSENYLNSGWIWPEGQALEGLMNINSFSVKFEKAGTYDYICLLHPWMVGKVIVR
jgi:plastocyanin